MRNSIARIIVIWSLPLFATVPATAQIEGGRSLSFSNIAAGFGARAMAMGGAFIAIADDVTAMTYNPAGLAQLLKPELSSGGMYGGQTIKIPRADLSASMSPGYDYYFSSSAQIKAHGFDFSYVGLVLPFRIGRIPLTVGFAHQVKASNVNADYDYSYVDSFGAQIEGISNHCERYITRSVIRTGTTNAETLSLAVRPFEFLHVGLNVNFWRGREGESNIGSSKYDWYALGVYTGSRYRVYETDSRYGISGGISYDAGLLLKQKKVSLGLVYKSGFRADYSYGYAWQDIWDGEVLMNGDNSMSGRISWPASFGAGLAVRPLDLLTICLDYTSTQWSKGKIELVGSAPKGFPADDPQNSHQLRAGLEYLMATPHAVIPIRAGWFDDRLYWNDVDGDPVKFTGLTAGTGLAFKGFILDVSAIIHFGTYFAELTDAGRTRRWSWDLLGSITYRIGS